MVLDVLVVCSHCGQRRIYQPRGKIMQTGYLNGKSILCFKCHKHFSIRAEKPTNIFKIGYNLKNGG